MLWCRRLWLLAVVGCLLSSGTSQAAERWQAGVSRVVITPEFPMWMSGYAGRTKPSEGKIHDLYARCLALRDEHGQPALFVALDLISVPAQMAKKIAGVVADKYQIPRANIMLTCSHTHCGPVLADSLRSMLFLTDEEIAKSDTYQAFLDERILSATDVAIADLQPAQLAYGTGNAKFASYRRPPIGTGPYDHEVPVLRILSGDGQTLRGLVFGYACHNTTLGFQMLCGDYAGFAELALEARHPGCVAMFHLGCGGDQNPLPRRKLELCEQYGQQLADAVDRVLESEMTSISGALQCAYQTVDLPFDHVPTQAELQIKQKSGNKHEQALAERLLKQLANGEALAEGYAYPVQVWQMGPELTWVALGGEIVVEYSLRLKQELGHGKTWVTGYANDVMAYIPSERVLKDGGYEGETSMTYYLIPTKWAPGLEDKIVGLTKTLAARLRGQDPLTVTPDSR